MKSAFLAILVLMSFTLIAAAADLSGKYTAEVPGRNGTQTNTFTFKVAGDKVEGAIATQRGDQPIEDGRISGDTLTFATSRPGRDGGAAMKTVYTGKVKGDTIEFSVDRGRGDPQTFTARKAQ
jgi:hypothetical protein